MLKKILFITAITFILVTVTSLLVYTYPSGITGRTKKTSTTGCSCHTQNTSIVGAITGPDTVIYGQTVNYTVTITRTGSTAKGGVDIATRQGTLSPGPGSTYLKYLNEELTHKNGLTLTNGMFSCQFSYTAPSVSAIDTIWLTEAIGYSNGWNWGLEKRIVVRNPLGISNSNTPLEFRLNQNYPNPFNPSTTINFEIPVRSDVTISVFDVSGREVGTIYNKSTEAGSHEIVWDASVYSSGIYFCTIAAGSYTDSKKMLLIK